MTFSSRKGRDFFSQLTLVTFNPNTERKCPLIYWTVLANSVPSHGKLCVFDLFHTKHLFQLRMIFLRAWSVRFSMKRSRSASTSQCITRGDFLRFQFFQKTLRQLPSALATTGQKYQPACTNEIDWKKDLRQSLQKKPQFLFCGNQQHNCDVSWAWARPEISVPDYMWPTLENAIGRHSALKGPPVKLIKDQSNLWPLHHPDLSMGGGQTQANLPSSADSICNMWTAPDILMRSQSDPIQRSEAIVNHCCNNIGVRSPRHGMFSNHSMTLIYAQSSGWINNPVHLFSFGSNPGNFCQQKSKLLIGVESCSRTFTLSQVQDTE